VFAGVAHLDLEQRRGNANRRGLRNALIRASWIYSFDRRNGRRVHAFLVATLPVCRRSRDRNDRQLLTNPHGVSTRGVSGGKCLGVLTDVHGVSSRQ
jgi:hypothetical protein